jgi:hypothetical protein
MALSAWMGTTADLRGESLQTLEALVAQWSELRLAVSTEQREWKTRESQLRAEIALLEKERAGLRKEIDSATREQVSIGSDRLASLGDKERLSEMLDGLPARLDLAEASLRAWPDRLPTPLREQLKPAFRPLMQNPDASARSPAARLQRIVGLYAEIEKLQHGVHVIKQVLTLPGGSRREVDVCFLGLVRGFAVSPDNQWAAIGTPAIGEWQWETRTEIADRVRLAVDIHNRERAAQLVTLPLAVLEIQE